MNTNEYKESNGMNTKNGYRKIEWKMNKKINTKYKMKKIIQNQYKQSNRKLIQK